MVMQVFLSCAEGCRKVRDGVEMLFAIRSRTFGGWEVVMREDRLVIMIHEPSGSRSPIAEGGVRSVKQCRSRARATSSLKMSGGDIILLPEGLLISHQHTQSTR